MADDWTDTESNEVQFGENAPPTQKEGPESEEEEELLKKLTSWERAARQHWSQWREEAHLCFDFVAGKQWSSDDKSALIEQMRQPVSFNRIGPMVDGVCGAEILNRQEVRFQPRKMGDVQVDELITSASEWARQLADTEDEESDAFADCVVCGMGWTETRMDYQEDPEGRIVCDRVDPFEMWPDPQSKKRNFADRRYQIRAKWWDKGALPANWKDKIPPNVVGGNSVDEIQTGWTGPRDNYERHDEPASKEPRDADKKRVWIRHIQWWDLEDVHRVADPLSGKVTTMEGTELRKMAQMFLMQGMRPPKAVKIQIKKFKQAFLCGNKVLEFDDIEAEDFTLKAITGKRDRNANTFYGIVRAMMDPQQWGNKFFVQMMHILNTSAKGGLLYETGSFTNPRKALDDWARPDAAIELEPGALTGGKVQERIAKNYPQGLEQMMDFAINALPQATGINLEMLGLVQQDQPAALEIQRKKSGYAILAVFFDSLRRYRKMQGRVQLYFIQHYISDGRLIKITGDSNTQRYIPLMRQPDWLEYDVIVDDAPMSPNQKEMVWSMMMQMMPILQNLQVPPQVWQLMLEYSPLPSNVSGKISQAIEQQKSQPPPPDPAVQKAQMEMTIQQKRAENQMQIDQQKAAGEHANQQQRLAIDQQNAEMQMQVKRIELEAAIIKSQHQMQAEREKHAMERERMAMEHHGRREELAMERERHGLSVALEQHKIGGMQQQHEHERQKQQHEIAQQGREHAHQNKGKSDNTQLIGHITKLVEAASAPSELVRDSTGRITGVRKVKQKAA